MSDIMGNLFNWVSDQLSSEDILDLYFVVSDLVDIGISEAEACETAFFDAKSQHAANGHRNDDSGIPMAKRVY